MDSLDFSLDKPGSRNVSDIGPVDLSALVDKDSLGTRGQDGLYEVKDWEFAKKPTDDGDADDFVTRALAAQQKIQTQQEKSGSSLGALGSIFARLTGSKTLNESDLKPVLDTMKQHLMKKNVAREIADKICEDVGEGLIGKKVGGFQSMSTPFVLFLQLTYDLNLAINATVRQALSTSLTRILTPNTSTDLLLSIRTKLYSPLASTQQRLPYSIVFVGVNGVGKSTNLSKVCFWLIQNGFKVLIAACDTFRYLSFLSTGARSWYLIVGLSGIRSGAVEQLRVHVRNLGMLDANGPDGKGGVELFERGYGKDAAGIAREAILYGNVPTFHSSMIDSWPNQV